MLRCLPKFVRSPAAAGALFALLASGARAHVTLAPLFANDAVLQRDKPLPIWGRADPGERVTVRFKHQARETVADSSGHWRVTLAREPASAEPAELRVAGSNTVRVENILVGDVWLCSGQSNMEWAVSTAANPKQEQMAANYPLIRHCKVVRTVAAAPAETVSARWAVCSPKTVLRFSAIGYFFARAMLHRLDVPIGIVTSAWGGTQIESWLSEPALRGDPAFAPVFTRWQERLHDFPAAMEAYRTTLARWEQQKAAALAHGERFTKRRPPAPEGEGSRWLPGGLYNGMIHPLLPFAFKGILWYQGEANEFRANEYARLFTTMIRQWRVDFQQGDLPFYFVQLSSFATAHDPTDQCWAFLREAQAQALALPNTGMIVTVDIGEPHNIHFKNKQEAGRRLSLLARARLYGDRIEDCGPMFDGAEREGHQLRVRFAHAAGLTSRGGPLAGFEVAGVDQRFVPAQARIEGDSLVVSADSVAQPVAVRYAWRNTPATSLYNAAGLPAAPFRSDNW